MEVAAQSIKDPETEASELQSILGTVGSSLREASKRRSKSGLSYAQFKANIIKASVKAARASHAVRR